MALKIEGFEELSKTFNRLENKMQKKAMRPALREGAKIAKTYVEANAPHEKLRKTKLKSSSKKGLLKITVNWPTRAELGIASDDPFYWPAIFEYGSPPHAQPQHPIFSKRSHPGVTAKPVLRPAIDVNRERIISAVARKLGQKIEQLAKR